MSALQAIQEQVGSQGIKVISGRRHVDEVILATDEAAAALLAGSIPSHKLADKMKAQLYRYELGPYTNLVRHADIRSALEHDHEHPKVNEALRGAALIPLTETARKEALAAAMMPDWASCYLR